MNNDFHIDKDRGFRYRWILYVMTSLFSVIFAGSVGLTLKVTDDVAKVSESLVQEGLGARTGPVKLADLSDVPEGVFQGSFFEFVTSTAAIDITEVGDTLLYDVPEGKKFFLWEIYMEITARDAPAFDESINIGYTSPSYDDLVSGAFFSTGAAVGDLVAQSVGSSITGGFVTSTQDLYYRVNASSTANALAGKAYVFGFLLDE